MAIEDTELLAGAGSGVPCEFITGQAGTGKTYLLRKLIQDDPTAGKLCATTGIAAINLDTVTINSVLGYFDTESLEDNFQRGLLELRIAKLATTVEGQDEDSRLKRLMIDEVSMMDGIQLDIIRHAVGLVNERRGWHEKDPFGITLTGDFCLHPDTPVMLASGAIKPASSIKVGDSLMGPNSTPRTVTRLFAGTAKMYKVIQTNGDSYTVTANHLIALKRGKDGFRKEQSKWMRYPKLPASIFVTAEALFNSSQKFREVFVGYKVEGITLPEKPVTVAPYFLGLWLGDGDKDCTRITTADSEVREFCENYATAWGLQCKIKGWGNRTKAYRVSLTTGRKTRNNPLLSCLRAYKVINNKHIPDCYLLNHAKVRLELLAGLLDSDGSWSGNRYIYCAKLEPLARQVKQLADGLGFRTSIYPQAKSWIVQISGDTWRIPTKVKRKKSMYRDLVKSRLTSVLKIERAGIGNFCGFEIDGDRLFLLGDGTVTHNCQLPPVKAKWAFEADCWPEFEANTTRLTKVWRQQDVDFLAAINMIRSGNRDGVKLLEKCGVEFIQRADQNFEGTTIIPKNEGVDKFNWLCHQKVQGRMHSVTNQRWGKQRSEWSKQIPQILNVKEGAYVMILTNDSPQFTFANGDCGHVIGEAGTGLVIRLVRNNSEVAISTITRSCTQRHIPDAILELNPGLKENEMRAKYAHEEDYEDDLRSGPIPYLPPQTGELPFWIRSKRVWVLGQINYMPLRLAYATTVHKSQGLTLDKLQVDVHHGFFGAPAMAYVALSRAKNAAGLKIIGTPALLASRVNTDPKVERWL